MRVRDLQDGEEIDGVLLVRTVERRTKRDGAEYLRLELGDRTGVLPAMVWEDLGAVSECAVAGEAVHVTGRLTVHARYGRQLNLRSVRRPAVGSYASEELRDGPGRPPEQMEADLPELIATVRNPHLRRLLGGVFDEGTGCWTQF